MFKTIPTVSTVELTNSLGMEIYAKLKSEWGVVNTIKLSLFDPENIKKVYKEISNVLAQRGIMVVKTPAVVNDEWVTTTPAVMEQKEITSDILTVATVLADFPVEAE